MNDIADAPPTPWHVRVVGIVALLWNAMGALDYTMTQTRNADYMAHFTQAQLDYFYGFPAWVVATWALGVWGGVAGSVGLLLRKRWTVPVFALSLAAMIITFVHNFLLADGLTAMGDPAALGFTAAIVAMGMALLLYARKLARHGVLRD